MRLDFETFLVGDDKEAARKLPEEAAEAFAEWVRCDELAPSADYRRLDRGGGFYRVDRLADELADVVMAACNLAARYGIDLQEAMGRCEARNRERGRYE